MAAAVVFDLDGTLVDTEPLADAAWRTVLADFGYEAADSDFAATRGLSTGETETYFRHLLGLEPHDDVVTPVESAHRALLEGGFAVFPDAAETLQELARRGVPLALATGSRRWAVDIKLRVANIGRYFDVVLTHDDVRRGKPAPDVYLLAAERLGIAPRDALAIEDTEVGADAAAAAGMRVLVVRRDGGVLLRHSVVSSLDPGLIQTIIGR